MLIFYCKNADILLKLFSLNMTSIIHACNSISFKGNAHVNRDITIILIVIIVLGTLLSAPNPVVTKLMNSITHSISSCWIILIHRCVYSTGLFFLGSRICVPTVSFPCVTWWFRCFNSYIYPPLRNLIVTEYLLIFPSNKSYLFTIASFLPNLVLVSQPSITLVYLICSFL